MKKAQTNVFEINNDFLAIRKQQISQFNYFKTIIFHLFIFVSSNEASYASFFNFIMHLTRSYYQISQVLQKYLHIIETKNRC